LQEDRSGETNARHRPPAFGPHGEDPPLRSDDRLIQQRFFTAPATSPSSDLRAIVGSLDTRPGALAAVGPDPHLVELLDATRAGLPATRTPAPSRSTSTEMRGIFFGQHGWPFSALCWLLVIATYGVALLVAWAVAYGRVRRAWPAEPASGEALEVRRVQVAQHWAREAHIEQLAPGTSTTRTTKFRVGITEQQTRDLSANLSMSTIRPEWPDLSARITSSRHTEESREIETTLQLSNDRTGFYRRIALWHPVDTVRIETLLLDSGLRWTECASATYFPSPAVATSFVDIAQADL
jgi:hypothetical protein